MQNIDGHLNHQNMEGLEDINLDQMANRNMIRNEQDNEEANHQAGLVADGNQQVDLNNDHQALGLQAAGAGNQQDDPNQQVGHANAQELIGAQAHNGQQNQVPLNVNGNQRNVPIFIQERGGVRNHRHGQLQNQVGLVADAENQQNNQVQLGQGGNDNAQLVGLNPARANIEPQNRVPFFNQRNIPQFLQARNGIGNLPRQQQNQEIQLPHQGNRMDIQAAFEAMNIDEHQAPRVHQRNNDNRAGGPDAHHFDGNNLPIVLGHGLGAMNMQDQQALQVQRLDMQNQQNGNEARALHVNQNNPNFQDFMQNDRPALQNLNRNQAANNGRNNRNRNNARQAPYNPNAARIRTRNYNNMAQLLMSLAKQGAYVPSFNNDQEQDENDV